MKSYPLFLLLSLLLALFTACGEDLNNEKYASKPPRFDAVLVENTTRPGASDVRVGDRLLLTAHQSQLGHLLYKADYHWGSTPVAGLRQAWAGTALYDNDPHHPVDTVCCDEPGRYNLTLTATYYTSGNVSTWTGNYTDTFADGRSTAQYTCPTFLYFQVFVSTQINVVR